MTEGLAAEYAGIVYKEFGREVVRTVDDEVVFRYYGYDVFTVSVFVICDNFNIAIE